MTRGIALLLTVGVLTLLSLAAVVMTAVAGRLRMATGLQSDQAAARLLARSGVAYASARLMEDPFPKAPASAGNQSDDWTCRDGPGTTLERTLNPSYAQTEPYTDLDGDGRYEPGTDTFAAAGDWNGNGRFDSWSGRLRWRGGVPGGSFALRIEPEDGKINVNDGYLDVQPHVNWMDIGQPWEGRRPPRCRDPGLRYLSSAEYDPCFGGWEQAKYDTWSIDGLTVRHRPLADLINELAGVAGVSQPPWIGDEIILHRPPGGYASLEELRKAVGPSWDALGRFFALGASSERVRSWGERRFVFSSSSHSPVQDWKETLLSSRVLTPVNAVSASVEVLQALVQGTCEFAPNELIPPSQVIQSSEARAFARGMASRLEIGSWKGWFDWLDGNKDRFFSGSPADQDTKVNAAEMQLNPDDLEQRLFMFTGTDYSWDSYDRDRGPQPLGDGGRLPRLCRLWEGKRLLNPPDPNATTALLLGVHGNWGSYPIVLTAPGRFGVESFGRVQPRAAAGYTASVDACRSLSLRHQSEFENLPSGRVLYGGACAAGRPDKDRVQTFPWFPIDSCPDQPSDQRFLCPAFGTIRLMDCSRGPDGGLDEVFYQPFWEEGQPMRTPARSAGTRENFADASRFKALPKSYAGGPAPMTPVWSGVEWLRAKVVFPGIASSWFEWGTGPGATPGLCPMFDAGGVLRKGAADYAEGIRGGEVSLGQNYNSIQIQGFPLPGGLPRSYLGIQVSHQGDQVHIGLQSVRLYLFPEPHLVACNFSELDGLQGYIDGTPDPGLHDRYQPPAVDPAKPQGMQTLFVDELRWRDHPQSDSQIAARSLRSRYWVPLDEAEIAEQLDTGRVAGISEGEAELLARLKEVPSFTSPLYSLPSQSAVRSVQWNGFVPKRLGEAVDAKPGAGPPLRVDLIVYSDAAGMENERVVRLPDDQWRKGGGRADLNVSGVHSLRYRVWMDASALDGFNNATPVFDSIVISYGSGSLLRMTEN